MPITLPVKAYRAFGIEHARLLNRIEGRLTKRDIASLLLSSFLIWGNLRGGRRFEVVSNSALLNEIERSIESNNAYDESAGNLNPQTIESLAATLSTIEILGVIFGKGLRCKSHVADVYQTGSLAEIMEKGPLEVLQGMAEFENKIISGDKVNLDNESIHYMVAISRRRDYSYAFLPEKELFLIADDRIGPVIMAGSECFGGRIHIEGNVITVDDRAGDVQRDVQRVVSYLRGRFGSQGYVFEVL